MMYRVMPEETKTSSSSSSSSTKHDDKKNHNRKALSGIRWLLLEFPLWIVLFLWASLHLFNAIYQGPIQTLIESFRRVEEPDDAGFYPDFFEDITYYNRQCTEEDVSTRDSNDIVVPANATREEATDIMMRHGAVLIPNILSKETATELRAYLETRNQLKDELSWFEKFWGDIGRLALGLGTSDNPIIAQAMKEVGNNEVLRTTLEGIVGPDPALVEISTLTTLEGAESQGIHTDSDYFASSLLYSRTFLHSYTLFMALQDTTPKMGATTLCPGTHWCANDDLSDVCVAPNAFEVSSNGQTGPDVGLLYKGDGMMFNQNIWHRGPHNADPMFPMNRVMFIVTFVSRQDFQKADVRQQGLGTYYYQRWNMWGHTYDDLKHATYRMIQPLGALRALGIWKIPNTKFGIVWLEHFARQLANDEDFFDSDELEDFLDFLDRVGVPRWLQGRKERDSEADLEALEWESFMNQLSRNVINLGDQIMLAALGIYTVLNLLLILATGQGTYGMLKRTFAKTFCTALLFGGLWLYITEFSHLGKRIKMKNTWRQPFPEIKSFDHLERTTLPTRDDVLVGTRFDAPFLSSFNHVLDYHPGNLRFSEALGSLKSADLLRAYMQQPMRGVTSRFLKQDWQTGYWSVMTDDEVEEHLAHALLFKKNKLKGQLDEYLKTVLADARFGWRRDTLIGRMTEALVSDWQSKLLASSKRRNPEGTNTANNTFFHTTFSVQEPKSSSMSFRTPSLILRRHSDRWVTREGDQVLASVGSNGIYVEAFVDEKVAENLVSVSCVLTDELADSIPSNNAIVSISKVRAHQPLVQGDAAEVQQPEGRWDPVEVVLIDPWGLADVKYPNGRIEEKVPLDFLRLANPKPVNFISKPMLLTFTVGQQVEVFDNDEVQDWFAGTVDQDNGDGTFAVVLDGGEYIENVPVHFIRDLPATYDPISPPDDWAHTVPQVGTRVKSMFGDDGWFPGMVAEVYEDGTYLVHFDDGEIDELPLSDLRRLVDEADAE